MNEPVTISAVELDRLAAELCAEARALGAEAAAPLAAGGVVVAERVRLKCRVPLCSSYGRNLMCPPNVPEPHEMRVTLAGYRLALVIQQAIPLTQAEVGARFGGRTYAEAHAEPGYVSVAADSQNRFATLMTALEAAAFKRGLRFAAAFSGGDCVLCPECVGQGSSEPCRHPFAARPSMEAVGIDVVATAANAGLAIELPAADHPRWTGLLLLD
jgi:predicted metal-binding protein